MPGPGPARPLAGVRGQRPHSCFGSGGLRPCRSAGYSPTLGAVAQELRAVGKRLDGIEAQPEMLILTHFLS